MFHLEMKHDDLGTGMFPSYLDQWLRTSRLIWCLATLPPSDRDKSSSQNVVFSFECKVFDKTQKASDDSAVHHCQNIMEFMLQKFMLHRTSCSLITHHTCMYIFRSSFSVAVASCFRSHLLLFIFIPSSKFGHSYFRRINLAVLSLF